jgi:hypothetical protein
VYALKVKAPQDKGPKTIKLFINQPRTLDFDMADSYQAVQELQYVSHQLSCNINGIVAHERLICSC